VDNNDLHDDDHDITAIGKSRNKTPERHYSLLMNQKNKSYENLKNSDENNSRRLDRSVDTVGVVDPLVSAGIGSSRGRGRSSSNIRSTRSRSSSKGLKSSKLDNSLDRIEEEGKSNQLYDDHQRQHHQQQHEAVEKTVFFKNNNDVDNMKSLTPLHKFRTYRMLSSTSISPTSPTNNDHQQYQQQYHHDYIKDTNRLSTTGYTAIDNKNYYKSNDDNDNDENLPLQPRSTYIPVRPKSSNAALRSDANTPRRSAISRPQSSGIVRTKRGDTAASATTTTAATIASTRSQLYLGGAAANTMRSFPSHFNTQLATTTTTLSSPSSSSPRSSSKLTTPIPSTQKLFYSPTTDSPRFQIYNSSSSFDHRQNNHNQQQVSGQQQQQQQQQHRHHQNPRASTDE
jgi:hypothetical protein